MSTADSDRLSQNVVIQCVLRTQIPVVNHNRVKSLSRTTVGVVLDRNMGTPLTWGRLLAAGVQRDGGRAPSLASGVHPVGHVGKCFLR